MGESGTEIETHPVQTSRGRSARISTKVTMAAYEVYCHLFGKQDSLITGNCRGGFSTGELIAFLYAKNFPRDEWDARFNEAIDSMDGMQ